MRDQDQSEPQTTNSQNQQPVTSGNPQVRRSPGSGPHASHGARPPLPPRPRSRKRNGLFLPLLLVGLVCFAFLSLIFVIFFAALFRGPTPVKITGKSVLRIQLTGNIKAYTAPSALDAFLDQSLLDVADYLDMIGAAADDQRIEGILLEVGFTNLSWAQMEDLREALAKFRMQGKWVIAFGELWQEREYFLASAAQEIYMPPEGVLNLDGFMSRTTFYASFLEKHGIGIHVEAHGEFKSMADGYRYPHMTEPVRQATQALLDTLERQFVTAVAAARELEPELVRERLNETVFQVAEAEAFGFLDAAFYNDQVVSRISELLAIQGKPQLIQDTDFWRGQNPSVKGDAIAIIYASGGIQSGHGGRSLFGDEVIASESLIQQLKSARKNPRVKAIVLRIDSPGGSQLASDVIWREIKQTSQDLPVFASMGGVAASGGYYLAMACDQIIAQPTTITGSIGVVSYRFDFEKLYEKFLVNVDVVKTSPSADFFDSSRALTQAEVQAWHRRTLTSYRSFVSKAADSRELEYNVLEQAARGRVWSGEDAKQFGLVDHLGSLDLAVTLAAEKAGLVHYQILRYPMEDDFFSLFKNRSFNNQAFSPVLKQIIPQQLRLLLDTSSKQGGFELMAIAPYHCEID